MHVNSKSSVKMSKRYIVHGPCSQWKTNYIKYRIIIIIIISILQIQLVYITHVKVNKVLCKVNERCIHSTVHGPSSQWKTNYRV